MPLSIRRAPLLAVALVAGCAGTPAASPAVLRLTDGPLWLYAEEIDRYTCEVGLLVCQDGIGRRSQRLCRCTR